MGMVIIEICGGIASGKTTFASLFNQNTLTPLYEDFKKSPFWESFYCNPGKYIFETEISFILLHYHQIKLALESNKNNLICDFSFLLDLAYAKIGMTDSKLHAFECVLDEVKRELPTPDLIVYLDCDSQTELERVEKRARAEESSINLEFLDSLNKALAFEVKQIKTQVPVITVNSAEKDFANAESTKKEMVKLIYDILKTQK
ncbi:deoxynucleoside kinase [bacterium]|nr:deoxynucleoside kinase [bacterium]